MLEFLLVALVAAVIIVLGIIFAPRLTAKDEAEMADHILGADAPDIEILNEPQISPETASEARPEAAPPRDVLPPT